MHKNNPANETTTNEHTQTNVGVMATTRTQLLDLPAELLRKIAEHLPDYAFQQFISTCRALQAVAVSSLPADRARHARIHQPPILNAPEDLERTTVPALFIARGVTFVFGPEVLSSNNPSLDPELAALVTDVKCIGMTHDEMLNALFHVTTTSPSGASIAQAPSTTAASPSSPSTRSSSTTASTSTNTNTSTSTSTNTRRPRYPQLCRLELIAASLTAIPDGLPDIRVLILRECSLLSALPNMPALEALDLIECNEELRIPLLPRLADMYVCRCRPLQLPPLPRLEWLLVSYGSAPTGLENQGALTTLLLDDADPPISPPKQVRSLEMTSCNTLERLPDNLSSLTHLTVNSCHLFEQLPALPSLTHLVMSSCRSVRSIVQLPQLTHLRLLACDGLESIAEQPQLTSLCVSGCVQLQTLPPLPRLRSLRLIGFPRGMAALPSFPALAALQVRNCHALTALAQKQPSLLRLTVLQCQQLECIAGMPVLLELSLHHCRSLRAVGPMPALQRVTTSACPQLTPTPAAAQLVAAL